ncbi:hypothetical protein UlMin_013227 [Ulmus minor]
MDRSNKGRGKSRSKSRVKGKKCYECHKDGHFRCDCPERKKKAQKNQEYGDAAVVLEGYKSADVLAVRTKESRGEWILDSGCTFHMCPRRELFNTYQSIDGGKVLMGNDEACKVIRIGTIKLKMFDGQIRTLSNVRHIPDLKRNLISLSILDEADDFSRKVWLYLMKHKNEALKKFKDWKALVESNLERKSRNSRLIMVLSISMMSSLNFANNKEYEDTRQL